MILQRHDRAQQKWIGLSSWRIWTITKTQTMMTAGAYWPPMTAAVTVEHGVANLQQQFKYHSCCLFLLYMLWRASDNWQHFWKIATVTTTAFLRTAASPPVAYHALGMCTELREREWALGCFSALCIPPSYFFCSRGVSLGNLESICSSLIAWIKRLNDGAYHGISRSLYFNVDYPISAAQMGQHRRWPSAAAAESAAVETWRLPSYPANSNLFIL